MDYASDIFKMEIQYKKSPKNLSGSQRLGTLKCPVGRVVRFNGAGRWRRVYYGGLGDDALSKYWVVFDGGRLLVRDSEVKQSGKTPRLQLADARQRLLRSRGLA